MTWFWLNVVPFAALILAAAFGVPMWFVLRHPDAPPMTTGIDVFSQVRPAPAASSGAARPADAASAERVAA